MPIEYEAEILDQLIDRELRTPCRETGGSGTRDAKAPSKLSETPEER